MSVVIETPQAERIRKMGDTWWFFLVVLRYFLVVFVVSVRSLILSHIYPCPLITILSPPIFFWSANLHPLAYPSIAATMLRLSRVRNLPNKASLGQNLLKSRGWNGDITLESKPKHQLIKIEVGVCSLSVDVVASGAGEHGTSQPSSIWSKRCAGSHGHGLEGSAPSG